MAELPDLDDLDDDDALRDAALVYWRHVALTRGDRNDRLRAEYEWSSVDTLLDGVLLGDPRAIRLLQAVADACPQAELLYGLGAGALETIIDGSWYDDWRDLLREAVRSSSALREALNGVATSRTDRVAFLRG